MDFEAINEHLKTKKTRARELRELNGFTRGKVARDIGMQELTYLRLENNPVGKTSVESYYKLAAYYGVSLDYLFGFETKPIQVTELILAKQVDEIEKYKKIIGKLEDDFENIIDEGADEHVFRALKINKNEIKDLETNDYSSLVELLRGKIIKIYPYNLLAASLGEKIFTNDFKKYPNLINEVETIMFSSLSENQIRVVRMRFINEMTLDKIGKNLSMSRERVRQIEVSALRKIKRALANNVFLFSKDMDDKKNKLKELEREIEVKKQQLEKLNEDVLAKFGENFLHSDLLNRKIETLALSNRSYNHLHRANIVTISDLLNVIENQKILKIRHIGVNSIQEIVNVLEGLGVLPETKDLLFTTIKDKIRYISAKISELK